MKRRYTVSPDLRDPRDYRMADHPLLASPVPAATHNAAHDGPIRDQGDEGSCTAFAGVGGLRFLTGGPTGFDGSPKGVYTMERYVDGDLKIDAGSDARTLTTVMRKYGVPAETDLPYDGKLRKTVLSRAMLARAAKHTIGSAYRVASIDELRAALAGGLPIMVGMSVPESFQSPEVAESGLLPPYAGGQILGGHEICGIDYDDHSRSGDVICRNSWGTEWGLRPDGAATRGYFKISYDAFFSKNPRVRLVMDVWAISLAPADPAVRAESRRLAA